VWEAGRAIPDRAVAQSIWCGRRTGSRTGVGRGCCCRCRCCFVFGDINGDSVRIGNVYGGFGAGFLACASTVVISYVCVRSWSRSYSTRSCCRNRGRCWNREHSQCRIGDWCSAGMGVVMVTRGKISRFVSSTPCSSSSIMGMIVLSIGSSTGTWVPGTGPGGMLVMKMSMLV
jgi:hypothetical protein